MMQVPQQWEYKWFEIDFSTGSGRERVAKEGRKGWELVSACFTPDRPARYALIFKRGTGKIPVDLDEREPNA